MITLSIILTALLLVLSGILFIPLRIVVNTQNKEYYISLPGYFRADLIFESLQSFRIKMRIFLFTFRIEPGRFKAKEEIHPAKPQKSGKMKNPLQLMKNQLKNFSIKRLNADFDTGDFPLNAQLIPATTFLNSDRVNININFKDENKLDMCITTRIYKILITFIKHYMSNK